MSVLGKRFGGQCGILGLAAALKTHAELQVGTATPRKPEHGLTKEVLAQTDVLTWWGYAAHDEVADELAARVQARVIGGIEQSLKQTAFSDGANRSQRPPLGWPPLAAVKS